MHGGEVCCAPSEDGDDSGVVDDSVWLDDGLWFVVRPSLEVELDELVGWFVCCVGRVVEDRRHSLDEVGRDLLYDHPIVSFNGWFREIAAAKLAVTSHRKRRKIVQVYVGYTNSH
jgi:hypothetical protein